MMNFVYVRGEWRRGKERVAAGTVRALHARGLCRLWVPITPETADALGWGPKATAREWHRFRFDGPFPAPSFCVGGSGPLLNVAVVSHDGSAEFVTFRLYARPPRPAHYEVIGAAPRKVTASGWCWEVAPRVGTPAIVEMRGDVEVARHEMRGDLCNDTTCCPPEQRA